MTDNRTTERVDHPPRVREAIDELMREKDVTDNRTTELLRKLLDERGVKYKSHYLHTSWYAGTKLYMATDDMNGTLTVDNLTPEQAIAATLMNTTCEYVIEDNMNESEGMGDVWFRCTNCDTCYDYYADDWLFKMPHCPKCGATVKGVR